MQGLGEEGIDLSFEDLDFVEDATQTEEESGENPNEQTEDHTAAEENEAAGQEATSEETSEEAEDNSNETTEGATPETVGGESAEGEGEQTSPQLYHSLATTLKEKGVLTSADDSLLKDVKSIDEFVDLMKKEIKAQEYNDLTDTQKEVLTGIREGATVTTVEKFKSAMTKLDKIDDDLIEANEKVRQDLIYQDFLSRGFTPEKAAEQVDRAVKLGVDLKDAKDAYSSLRTAVKERYETAKAADIAKSTEEAEKVERRKENLKELILKKEEVIEGFKVPETTRKEVYEEMMKQVSINPKTKTPENSLMKYQRENPEEFSHKLYYLWKLSNGFKDLKYFGGKTKTSSVKDLERAIKNSTHIQGGGDPSYSDDINTGLLDVEDIVLPD